RGADARPFLAAIPLEDDGVSNRPRSCRDAQIERAQFRIADDSSLAGTRQNADHPIGKNPPSGHWWGSWLTRWQALAGIYRKGSYRQAKECKWPISVDFPSEFPAFPSQRPIAKPEGSPGALPRQVPHEVKGAGPSPALNGSLRGGN